MQDPNRPLYSLSVKEFQDLQNEAHEKKITEIVQTIVNVTRLENQKEESDTINLTAASIETGLKEKSIYSKVSRLEIPVLTRGRPLMFSRAELQLWMKLGKPSIVEMEIMKRKGQL